MKRASFVLVLLFVTGAHAGGSTYVALTEPYGSLMGCSYFRGACGVPIGVGLKASVSLPAALQLELGVDLDVHLAQSSAFAFTPMLGLWRPFEVSPQVSLYPRADLGVSLFPSGFEVVSPYYDLGGGLLWRLDSRLTLRAEVTFRGARIGVSFDWR